MIKWLRNIRNIEEQNQRFTEMVSDIGKKFGSIRKCDECKALFWRDDLSTVEVITNLDREMKRGNLPVSKFAELKNAITEFKYYCPEHKKNYSRKEDGRYYQDDVEIKLKK